MKIIEFHGGLGNQMFEYTYYKYLKEKFPEQSFFSYCPKRAMSVHNGLEINKWFDVVLARTSILSNIVGFVSYWGIRILRKIHLHPFWVSDDFHLCDEKLYHEGWYQNKMYYQLMGGLNFKADLTLNNENKKLLEMLKNTNSVAIHIRRGDYLMKKNKVALGNICTENYYRNAINKISDLVKDAYFFIFSDDPEFASSLLSSSNKIVVTGNTGENSFYDMYLMAHAHNMILANSTFSCWAAYLNKDAKHVICPSKWNNKMNLDLSLDTWIKLSS